MWNKTAPEKTEVNDDANNDDNLDVIDEFIDVHEELLFIHEGAIVWTWNNEQSEWRKRGNGELCIHFSTKRKLAKIKFTDTKHDRTRLLQWIDGKSHAKINPDISMVDWCGTDYTMDQRHGKKGHWWVKFFDNASAAQEF